MALFPALALSVAFGILYLVVWLVPGASGLIDRHFIFFPQEELVGTPLDWNLPFDEVRFQASDGVNLHGWFVAGERDVTWIWFHGNGGNISHRLENLALFHRDLGVNIFLFDYRGYGSSEGQTSEEGTYRDARGALDYVLTREDVNPDRIIYFGRSLGAAVAVWLATEKQPYGLILESPFASIKDMADIHYGPLPVRLLVRTKYDSLSRISRISSPLLIVHGDQDELVPVSQAQKLYDVAGDPKGLYLIPGAGHNDTYVVGGTPYLAALRDFISSLPGQD